MDLTLTQTVVQYRRLVFKIAKRYRRKGIEFEDLVQEGYVGLIHAYETYDPTQSKFITWAHWHIVDHLQRFFHKNMAPVILPREFFKGSTALPEATRDFVQSVLKSTRINNFDNASDVDCLPASQKDPSDRIFARLVLARVDRLRYKEKKILIDHGVREKTLDEIGSELDVTRERVRQVYNIAVRKVRKTFQHCV